LDPVVVEGDLAGYEQISPAFAYDLGDDQFQSAYNIAFGDFPNTFANTAYDAVVLVMLAAEEAGSTDPTAIREHMPSVSADGTLVSDFAAALQMVRDGEDIDWQGTYAGQVDGFSYEINHDFEPDGETINPYLVLQIEDGGAVAFVDTISDTDLQTEEPQISLYIAGTMSAGNPGEFIQAVHQLGLLLEDASGLSVSTFVPPGDTFTSQETTITALGRGVADLARLDWLTHLVANETAGAEIALTNIRFGQPYFFSQIWTHEATGFTSLADLQGALMCYGDPSSASSYVIPSLMLMAEGLDPFENADIIGSHPGVIEALYHQACDGGASFFDARDLLEGTYPDVKEVVLPLELSPQIPNEGFSFAAHVPEAQRDAVISALLEVSSTAEGLELLGVIGGSSQGLVQTDQSIYSGLEALFADAGLNAEQVWGDYYMP
jgi:phosphate/phosphite/phosphonate ABC transporter binding protein